MHTLTKNGSTGRIELFDHGQTKESGGMQNIQQNWIAVLRYIKNYEETGSGEF